MSKKLSGSMEDYLESILVLRERKTKVRVTDIAAFLSVSRPSVVSALALLKEKGLVVQLPYGDVRLTEQGEEEAQEIYGKHVAIRRFLHEFLGVDREIAEEDACRIEHLLHQETIQRMRALVKDGENG